MGFFEELFGEKDVEPEVPEDKSISSDIVKVHITEVKIRPSDKEDYEYRISVRYTTSEDDFGSYSWGNVEVDEIEELKISEIKDYIKNSIAYSLVSKQDSKKQAFIEKLGDSLIGMDFNVNLDQVRKEIRESEEEDSEKEHEDEQ